MTYESFDNKHRRQKNIIILWASIIVGLLTALLILIVGQRQYAIYKTAPYLDVAFLERDICHAGFNSIVKRGAVSSLVEDSYIDALQKEEYGMVDLDLNKKDYRLVKMERERICKIIVRDKSTQGHGLRSFKIKLKHDPDYVFNYKVASVAEVLLDESDLKWR